MSKAWFGYRGDYSRLLRPIADILKESVFAIITEKARRPGTTPFTVGLSGKLAFDNRPFCFQQSVTKRQNPVF